LRLPEAERRHREEASKPRSEHGPRIASAARFVRISHRQDKGEKNVRHKHGIGLTG